MSSSRKVKMAASVMHFHVLVVNCSAREFGVGMQGNFHGVGSNMHF